VPDPTRRRAGPPRRRPGRRLTEGGLQGRVRRSVRNRSSDVPRGSAGVCPSSSAFLNLGQVVGDQAVRLAVHRCCRFRIPDTRSDGVVGSSWSASEPSHVAIIVQPSLAADALRMGLPMSAASECRRSRRRSFLGGTADSHRGDSKAARQRNNELATRRRMRAAMTPPTATTGAMRNHHLRGKTLRCPSCSGVGGSEGIAVQLVPSK
jgi:hypothetical protein